MQSSKGDKNTLFDAVVGRATHQRISLLPALVCICAMLYFQLTYVVRFCQRRGHFCCWNRTLKAFGCRSTRYAPLYGDSTDAYKPILSESGSTVGSHADLRELCFLLFFCEREGVVVLRMDGW